jgi:lysophospholipase L1-like esterase
MRKVAYVFIAIILFLIISDRVLKVYEKKWAQGEIKDSVTVNPVLTAEQNKDYRMAGTVRLLPYTVFGYKPNFTSKTVNINSLGLRGGEIGEKKNDVYRIAIIGGSSVFGGEVPSDDLTFSKLLESKLNTNGQNNYEVINAGAPAYVSMQELILLEDKIIDLKPDMLIVFDGFNDFLTVIKRDPRPNYPWWFNEVEKVYYTSITKLFVEKKLRKFRITKHILNMMEKKKEKDKEYTVNKEQVAFYRRNLDLMCHLAKSYGIKVVLVFQPVALYKQPLNTKEEVLLAKLDQNYLKALKEMCDLGKEAMREVAIANAVPFIDGTQVFNNNTEDIFIDEVHFNQRGHTIVADILYDRVKGTKAGATD